VSDVVRVLLAEPDAPTRAGRLALEAKAFEICAEPVDAHAAVEIAVRDRPDVCLIGEGLPGGAIIAVEAMYRRLPDTRLVMLTESEEPESLFAAIRAGASGYVRTDLDPSRLAATIRGCSPARPRFRGA
jgi:DNA-binding NarL/FixJ family response regulator